MCLCVLVNIITMLVNIITMLVNIITVSPKYNLMFVS